MSEHVWVSTAAASSPNHFQFHWPKLIDDIDERVELTNALKRDFRKGAALEQTRFPDVLETAMKSDVKSKLPRKLPPYVNWTCPVLEQDIIDVMQQFDLGGSNFYPVMMRRLDKDQIYDQDFSILNIAVAKDTLVPEQSGRGVREHPLIEGSFSVRQTTKEDQTAVHRTSLEGPDIWVDPKIRNRCFFISDRLKAALEIANFSAPFELRRCRIADDRTGRPSLLG
jgi:hypothetical protein